MRLTWSPDGTKILFAASVGGAATDDIWVVNADGTGLVNLTNTPNTSETYPAWSPNGQQIVYSYAETAAADLYVMDASGANPKQLTTDPAAEWFPTWSPDGKLIAYFAGTEDRLNLFIMNADGTNPVLLAENVYVPAGISETGPAFSPDGKRIAYVGKTTTGSDATDLFSVRTDGTDRLQYTAEGSTITGVNWSPDGAWLIFTSYVTGNLNVYAIKPNGTGFVTLTDVAANEEQPRWGKPVPPSGAPTATPAPGVTPGPTAQATSAHPGSTDLLLFYDANVPVFTLQNTSGGPVNLTPLSFSGAGKTVSANIWNSEFLSSPLDKFAAGGCLQIWHFSLGTLQSPAECGTNRQGWVADETSIFWTQGTFDVLYNGVKITTCDVAAGRCVIDLP
jgi:dipeptidyl aminopeptidase/acylaminoacyl peptidase